MDRSVAPLAVSAYVIHGQETLLIRRSDAYLTGTWQMVSGNIEPPETAWEAALREIKEETNLVPDRFYSADFVETFYVKKLDRILFVPVFVAILNRKAHVTLKTGEHDAYEWLPFAVAQKRLVFCEQKRAIAHVHEFFIRNSPPEIMRIL